MGQRFESVNAHRTKCLVRTECSPPSLAIGLEKYRLGTYEGVSGTAAGAYRALIDPENRRETSGAVGRR